jgi:hypothetical protein
MLNRKIPFLLRRHKDIPKKEKASPRFQKNENPPESGLTLQQRRWRCVIKSPWEEVA